MTKPIEQKIDTGILSIVHMKRNTQWNSVGIQTRYCSIKTGPHFLAVDEASVTAIHHTTHNFQAFPVDTDL